MRKNGVIVALVILGVVIVVFATDILFLWIPFIGHTPEYGTKASAFFMALTAFITLLLASATFHSTEQMNLRENQHRNDATEKEKRDRKDQLLNDIINWSIDTRNITVSKSIQALPKPNKHDLEMYKLSLRFECSADCDIALIRGVYIKDIVSSLWKELIPDVNKLIRQLKQYGDILKNKIPDTSENAELNKFSEIVINKATKIKTDILLIVPQ